ncbi:MAG: creatininase family protein [Candidatus Dormibacteria bacterium]|jgi:creatinine amidohydrolase
MIWGEAASPALRGAPHGVALWPIGATEQHGPHLPVDTDSRIAETVCRLAAGRAEGTAVLPTLAVGCSAAHTDRWPGTLAVLPRTLIGLVAEVATWIEASGWERLLLVNGHVGNVAPLRCAVDELRHTRASLHAAVVNTWELHTGVLAAFSDDAADWHANRAETSLLMVIAPELVGDRAAADDPDRTRGTVFPWNVAATSRNGVTGRPSDATAAEGRQLLDTMVTALALIAQRAATETAPLPRVSHPGPELRVEEGGR